MWAAENNGYIKKEYGWWWHYTRAQVDVIKRRMNNNRRFSQEYELEFATSGRSVFDQAYVRKQRKNILKVGDPVPGEDYKVEEVDGLRIYRRPRAGEVFVAGADVAEGVAGGDYSVAQFFNRETGEEVGFYRGLISPDRFGEKLDQWGRKFNNATLAVEINNHGGTTMTILKQKAYPCLYYRPKRQDTISDQQSDRLGWLESSVTRPLLLDDIGRVLNEESMTIHSKETLDEMMTFVYNNNNDATAQSGFHDDTIFAFGCAIQAFKVVSFKPLEQIDYSKYIPHGIGNK